MLLSVSSHRSSLVCVRGRRHSLLPPPSLLLPCAMPLQPLLCGLFHDVRRGPVHVERRLLDRSNDVRIHCRQELSFVAWRGFSSPSWRRFFVRHRPACVLCNPGNRPMGCGLRQGTGTKAWSLSPTVWPPSPC